MTYILTSMAWVVGALLSVASFPATVLLLGLTIAALRPKVKSVRLPAQRLRLCALIPAHNEELLIARCVRSLLASGGRVDFAVYVVADNCSDSTAAVAAEAGAHVLVRTDVAHRGKGYALDYGFEKTLATGADVVLVVDADSVVSPDLVETVRQYVEGGAGAVQCRYRVMGPKTSVRGRLMDLAFLGVNVLRPAGRDRAGVSAGILGNGFALTAATLKAVPYRAESIVEDLEYHILLVRAGYRVRFANEATVYGEMPGGGAAASSQRSRWEGGRLRMLLQWAPQLAADISGGRVKCIEPLIDLLALPLAFQAFLLVVLAAVAPQPFKWWAGVKPQPLSSI